MATINSYPDDNLTAGDDKYLTYDNSGTVKLTSAQTLRDYVSGTPVNYNPTVTGFSALPAGSVYRYILQNKICTIFVSQPNNGTSNATDFTISLPFPAANVATGYGWRAMTYQPVNNGAINTTNPGLAQILNGESIMTLFRDSNSTIWTASGGKRVPLFSITYEIA